MFILILLLVTVISSAVAMNGSINATVVNLHRRFRPIVSIDLDWDVWDAYRNNFDSDEFLFLPPLTVDHVNAIGSLEEIHFYDYVVHTWGWSFGLTPFHVYPQMFPTPEGIPEFFRLRGTSQTELIQIEQGAIDLIAGRQFFAEELTYQPNSVQSVAMISEAFANENDLTLGSMFSLYQFVRFPDEEGNTGGNVTPEFFSDENVYARIDIAFEVIGLFDVPYDRENPEFASWVWEDELNAIYVPNWVFDSFNDRRREAEQSVWEAVGREAPQWFLEEQEMLNQMEQHVNAIFVLENPENLDKFKEAITPLLPHEAYYIVDLFNEFDDIATAMGTLQDIANWVLYGSIGMSILILSLVITLFLHERRREIGIYLSLGEKKGKIISQILAEVVVIAIAGITIALFTGNQIAGIASQRLLENELLELTSDRDVQNSNGTSIFNQIGFPPRANLSPEEMMEAFDVSLNIEAVVLFYVTGLGTVMTSTLIPVIYVIRLKPKELLL
ncbi:MAG: FtsX-like permease family protein [Defluviitaleaceae bacterium]|nr:FtsX-like permease family protein [Defluviitaleaceae bacterium]